MKVLCACGQVLRDQTDNLPFKAYVRADEDDGTYADLLSSEVERMVRAFAAAPPDAREQLLKRDLDEFGMVGVWLERQAYACVACGRLLLVSAGGHVDVYAPEGDRRGVLQSTRPDVSHKPPQEW